MTAHWACFCLSYKWQNTTTLHDVWASSRHFRWCIHSLSRLIHWKLPFMNTSLWKLNILSFKWNISIREVNGDVRFILGDHWGALLVINATQLMYASSDLLSLHFFKSKFQKSSVAHPLPHLSQMSWGTMDKSDWSFLLKKQEECLSEQPVATSNLGSSSMWMETNSQQQKIIISASTCWIKCMS